MCLGQQIDILLLYIAKLSNCLVHGFRLLITFTSISSSDKSLVVTRLSNKQLLSKTLLGVKYQSSSEMVLSKVLSS